MRVLREPDADRPFRGARVDDGVVLRDDDSAVRNEPAGSHPRVFHEVAPVLAVDVLCCF